MSIRGPLGFFNTATSRTHVRFSFSTHEAAGGNVAPSSAFEAADLRIYKATDGAAISATQRSSASGITMTSPFDTLTGVHSVTIDLTDNTDAGFYASDCYYEVWLCPDETVDGQTITGVCLCSFEIGEPVVASVTGNVGGNVTGSVGSVATGGITRASFAADTGLQTIRSNTAQGGNGSSITLDASASSTNDYYNGCTVYLTGGTGVGQINMITDYNGTTKVATTEAWSTAPDNTTTFAILPHGPSDVRMVLRTTSSAVGLSQAGDEYANDGRFTARVNALDPDVVNAAAIATDARAVIQTEATDALNAYDPPTNAEMEARTLVAASYATATALALVAADLPVKITKNTAFTNWVFKMVDSTDHVTPEIGLTITATRSLDGAEFASCANAATEISNGWYKIDLAAADVNGNSVILRFTATGADANETVLITQPT